MNIYIHKTLIEKWVSFGALKKHYDQHTLPLGEVEYIPIDFKNQDQNARKYPLFPYMTFSAYNDRAEKLNHEDVGKYGSSSPVVGWINYSYGVDSVMEPEPRIVKYRKQADIGVIKRLGLGNDFGEMIITNLAGDIISYYLVDNRSDKAAREYNRAIYDLDGTPVNKGSFIWRRFQDDENAIDMIDKYFSRQGNDDDKIDEAYSPAKSLTDRYGRVIGYISVDRISGDQMLQDRYGAVKGWYHKFSDCTVDRFGRVIGFGNILATLLDKSVQ